MRRRWVRLPTPEREPEVSTSGHLPEPVDEQAEPEPVKAEHVCYCRHACTCGAEPEPPTQERFDSVAHYLNQQRAWQMIQRANGDYRRRPFRRTERV